MQNQSDWPTATEGTARRAETGIDLNRLFFSHKLLLVLMISVGMALGYLKFSRTTPEYASSAQVLVARNDVQLPVEGAERMARRQAPLDTHIALMRTPVILDKAVHDANLGELMSLAGSPNPASVIAAGLEVAKSEQSDEILDLTYRGPNRYDCQTILNAVITAYVEFVKESQESLNERTVHLISEAKEELTGTLTVKEEEYQQFREGSTLIWNGDEPQNIHRSRLLTIESLRTKIRSDSSLLLAEMESIREALEKGVSEDAILMRALNSRPESEMIRLPNATTADETAPAATESPESPVIGLPEYSESQLLPLLIQEQKLLESHGPEHPKVKSLRKEIQITRDYIKQEIDRQRRAMIERQKLLAELEARREAERLAAGEESGGEERLQEVKPNLLAVYIESLEQERSTLDRQLSALSDEYDKEEEAARVVAADENRHRVLKEEINRSKRLFDVLLEELQEISLVKDGAFLAVEAVTPPGPGWQVAPKLADNLVLGGLIGFLCGLGLSFLFEMSDRSFRGPEQIMSQLGLPVVGHIPTISGKRATIKGSQLDKTLVAYHRPKSRLAESYRAVRVPILFGAKQQGLKVLQITSPDPGDGKSTLSANLAIVMANSGKRCLLVDADFRRPKIHKVFGVSNANGFSMVIQGESEVPDAIQTSAVENLDLLTTGPRVSNAAELILSPGFESTLQLLREKYDFVILDTPPVLAVTDPAAVASRVDAVLLVLRITKRVQLHAARAKETLELIGANILGVVVNGIGEASGYAYGTGVYSSTSSKYQYSNSPYYGSYYNGYARYGDYYTESDGESSRRSVAAKAPAKPGETAPKA